MPSKYYHDDCRLRATAAALDISKTWAKNSREDHLKALTKWNEICKAWYEDHKEYADSEEGIADRLNELRNAFTHLRKKARKTKQDQD